MRDFVSKARIGAVLAFGPALSLGVGRFSYAILLPAMKADLHWSYQTAGAMNTANALGYLIGSLLAPWCARRGGERRTFLAGILILGAALAACGLFRGDAALLALRFFAGASGAWIFIAGAALAASNGPREDAPLTLALYFGGVGLGIALTGLALPSLLARHGPHFWQAVWQGMGWGTAALGLMLWPWLRRVTDPPSRRAGDAAGYGFLRPVGWGLGAYLLFGVGYITYMTFAIAYVRTHGGGAAGETRLWTALGLTTMAAPALWRHRIAQPSGGRALGILMLLCMAGSALPLLSPAWPVMLASAVLMGASFIPIVAAVTALVRRAVAPERVSDGIAALTVVFALGQTVGPYVSGALSDRYGLSAGLRESALMLAAGAVLAFRQREPTQTKTPHPNG